MPIVKSSSFRTAALASALLVLSGVQALAAHSCSGATAQVNNSAQVTFLGFAAAETTVSYQSKHIDYLGGPPTKTISPWSALQVGDKIYDLNHSAMLDTGTVCSFQPTVWLQDRFNQIAEFRFFNETATDAVLSFRLDYARSVSTTAFGPVGKSGAEAWGPGGQRVSSSDNGSDSDQGTEFFSLRLFGDSIAHKQFQASSDAFAQAPIPAGIYLGITGVAALVVLKRRRRQKAHAV